ncbi:MAG: class I SAM-dependent methyltransferase [Flavobacteriales bacterium]
MEEDIYRPEYVMRLFDGMSASYERMNYITSFGFSIRWRNQFLGSFKPTDRPVEVIDLLTGMGETWSATNARFPNANFSALDFSEGMLKYAKRKSQDRYQGRVKVLKQDVLQNDLPSERYDLVTCAFGLKTFDPAQLQVLAMEVKRILKPGGEFAFIEVSKPEGRILSMCYGFYLGRVIPLLGRLFLGDPDEYRMLWRYTNRFGNAKQAAEIFETAGLSTRFISYFSGCATGFSGRKR